MYEIPKISVPVELLLMNGETVEGKMFVTEDLVSAEGNPLIEEFLNEDPNHFFSFESNAGAYRLINKDHLILVKSTQNDDEIKHQTPLPPKNLVVHFTNDRTVYGVIYPTLAEESRASDIINQESTFIVLYQNGQKMIINRNHIIYINAN
ncbi:MAG: hypothetical protein CMQ20_09445 [Gammaproteobacteria bacterium]|jgi:hypothetical protein|nr:hypothetical protein [Gammaproteobacteria bacterium]|tara:strand:- start:77 stop:526 length:450 start_codon:yes stop_codon:yes gene_type:complete